LVAGGPLPLTNAKLVSPAHVTLAAPGYVPGFSFWPGPGGKRAPGNPVLTIHPCHFSRVAGNGSSLPAFRFRAAQQKKAAPRQARGGLDAINRSRRLAAN